MGLARSASGRTPKRVFQSPSPFGPGSNTRTHQHDANTTPAPDLSFAHALPAKPYYYYAGIPSSGLPSLDFTETTSSTAPAAESPEQQLVRWVGAIDNDNDGIGLDMAGEEAWWYEELVGPVSEKIADEDLMDWEGEGGWCYG